ncbi:MAG TPA: LacI family DNA-binding transcriptional regulator [Polyangia bacterium]|jgi:DNA-binding LacI/PurR family transcriptional regulator|nr:LacI family DNA-binding transcriptional regulator [Polyangia bacterium]
MRLAPPAKAEVKLRHVARHAGVSESTVSNVMNGRSEKVGPETFQRVVESIRALNYQPSHAARLLRTGHTPMLGLLVPSIANPFFSSLARELDEAAQKRGYRLLLGNTYRDPEKEHEFLEELMRYGARGAITTSSLAKQSQYVTLIERGLSMVSFDRRASPDFTLPIDYVSIDNFHAGHAATQYLLTCGHTAIRYMTAPAKTLSRIDRRNGYQAAMKEAGLEAAASMTEAEATSTFMDSELPEVGRRMAKELAGQKDRPTALVAMNDMLAIGLIAGLHESGLNVPDDVSVIGIDDIYLNTLITPALTSMRQPLSEIAETMVERIRLRLTSPRVPTTERVFKAELVVRASVKDLTGQSR